MKAGRILVAVVMLATAAVLFLPPVNDAFGRAVDAVTEALR